jgi:hypothetical protein
VCMQGYVTFIRKSLLSFVWFILAVYTTLVELVGDFLYFHFFVDW